MQEVLCDTSVFVALWAPSENAEHQVFSKQFFKDAKDCLYSVNVSEVTRNEIQKKYSYLAENYMSQLKLFAELKKLLEFTTPEDSNEIHKIRQKAKENNFDLSFVDALIIYIAKKKNMLMLSWDNDMIDFTNEMGVDARKPSQLQ